MILVVIVVATFPNPYTHVQKGNPSQKKKKKETKKKMKKKKK